MNNIAPTVIPGCPDAISLKIRNSFKGANSHIVYIFYWYMCLH